MGVFINHAYFFLNFTRNKMSLVFLFIKNHHSFYIIKKYAIHIANYIGLLRDKKYDYFFRIHKTHE